VQNPVLFEPLHEIAQRLDRGDVSCVELVRATIERTESLEPGLNSYIAFRAEEALADARRCDQERRQGQVRGPFHGIPVTLKDVFDVANEPTTAGAWFLREQVAERDCEAWRRLREAGAVLLGKSNLNKFAGGESGANPDFGNMHNPWNRRYSPSGSSGGSAAQVAAGLAALSLGSDNGGSVRNPASVCNIVGLKPTHARVSTDGMFPRAHSVDHVGILTRTIRDAAIALEVLAGRAPGDDAAARRPSESYVSRLDEPLHGTKLGVDRSLLRVAEPGVISVFENVLDTLGEIGFEVVDVTVPTPEEMMPAMYCIFFCEWGSSHEDWMRSHPEEYAGGSRAALLIPATDYLSAQRERRVFQRRMAEAIKDVDLLVSPTYPMVRRAHAGLPTVNGRRLTVEDALRFTMPYDLLGLPAVSLPGGFAAPDAPVGFQIAGRAFEEAAVLRAAYEFERATKFYEKHPTLE
jgi:aspartyl-tRNA(Asn)/glutamyl-tRNA(Gln) amidotransferase subunit A